MKVNKIYNGDCLSGLKGLPDGSVDCVITSPPYWALRDYGVDGQLGLEPTVQEYISKLLEIFDEVRRVLKPTGTCWVNLGDTYGGTGSKGDLKDPKYPEGRNGQKVSLTQGKMEKCLIGVPERFMLGMIDRGWILRNKIVWHKPNCMPSSAKDRFTVDFEPIFFFVKSKKYFFDMPREAHTTPIGPLRNRNKEGSNKGLPDGDRFSEGERTGYHLLGRSGRTVWADNTVPYSVQPRDKDMVSYRNLPDLEEFSAFINRARKKELLTIESVEKFFGNQAAHHWFNGESFPDKKDYLKLKELLHFDGTYNKQLTEEFEKSAEKVNNPNGRAARTVWRITTQPFGEAHFATFPEELVRKPLLAGCPEFVCKACGKPREKIMGMDGRVQQHWAPGTDVKTEIGKGKHGSTSTLVTGYKNAYKEVGWSDCGCNAGWKAGVVLDPFMGAGTVALVAKKNNRNFIGFELSQEYIKIAEKRIKPWMEQKKLSETF